MRMSGNMVLITGGATGIGFAMAKSLHAAGNEVIICGRRQRRLDEAAAALPGIHMIRADVTDDDDRQHLLAEISSNYPALNVLINNAGIQKDVDLADADAVIADESEIAVNLEAPIVMSALFTPLLAGKANATIVNVSSALAFMVERATRCPIYCATKAGLHAFCIAQRIQLQPLGIRVVEIIPPAVESELNMESRVKRGFVTSPYMLSADDFVAAAFSQMADDADEIRVNMKR